MDAIPQSASRSILIVEDDVNTAVATAELFRARGFGALVAHDGVEGLEIAILSRPDVVLLDVRLPGLNGYEVLEQLREHAVPTRVIVHSGHERESAAVTRLIRAGACAYLPKPTPFGEIFSSVRRALAVERTLDHWHDVDHRILELEAALARAERENRVLRAQLGGTSHGWEVTGETPAVARRLFLGHGGNRLWARVQVFLTAEANLPVETYESTSRVGESIGPVLESMLDRAAFAVLVLTAEDDVAGGGRRARQNVIHEAGLFQGRLGFRRVVLLVHENVEAFSNIAGMQQIRFSGDDVERTFYDLQRVLRREGLARHQV